MTVDLSFPALTVWHTKLVSYQINKVPFEMREPQKGKRWMDEWMDGGERVKKNMYKYVHTFITEWYVKINLFVNCV